MKLRGEALRLAGDRRRVLPLVWTDAAGHCSCRNRACPSAGKHPLLPHGVLDASADETVIGAWWERWPEANLGATCDMHAVLDVDDATVADDLFAVPELRDRYPLRQTPRGLHIEVRASVSSHPLFATDGRKVGDLKGRGGYVVMPPSCIGEKGYRKLNGIEPPGVNDIHAWVREVLGLVGVELGAASDARRAPGWVAHRLVNLSAGHRNIDLFAIAARLQRGGFSAEDIFALLAPHAERADLPLVELERVCRSAGRYPTRVLSGGPIHVA